MSNPNKKFHTLSSAVAAAEIDACFVCDGDTGRNRSKSCTCMEYCGHIRCCGDGPPEEIKQGWAQAEDAEDDGC